MNDFRVLNEEEMDEAIERVNEAFPEPTRFYLFRRKLRFLWQRLTRGWSDDNTWNLDIPIAKFVLPRLRRFKEINNGYPSGMTEEEWDEKIDQMTEAFDLLIKTYDGDVDETVSTDMKIDDGLELFGEHLRNLWW
ncbi:hypothetical protein LCGC14_0236190 [marine sediment metagenome]|uniref:Uncharacterized protein n=1 Tax=marine sediment metagenome TaxID=412755 RepID=A0A0F9XDD7_9ZZZZ